MKNNSNAKALMAYSFLVVFGNDDTIDEDELRMIENLALKDDVIDDEEKRILRNLFARVDKDHLTETVWQEIQNFRHQHGI